MEDKQKSDNTISFDDFRKLDIRIGKIVEAEKVEGADKLMKLQVDFGSEKRQIVSGIAEFYSPDELKGRECPFVFNLEPKRFRGQESQGMIMAVDTGSDCMLLHPNKEVEPGAKVT
jgi:methionine--tRNA ligase beta chain